MPYMDILNFRRRNAFEIMYTMLVCNDDGSEGTQFVNNVVVERFGRPRIYHRMLRDQDLNPEYEYAHRGSAQYVCSRFETGNAGRFKIRNDGSFLDYHGGNGLSGNRNLVFWFTEQALRRGIGWTFIQTYTMNNRRLARFHVSRIFRRGSPYTLEVIKRRV